MFGIQTRSPALVYLSSFVHMVFSFTVWVGPETAWKNAALEFESSCSPRGSGQALAYGLAVPNVGGWQAACSIVGGSGAVTFVNGPPPALDRDVLLALLAVRSLGRR
jgi:hypothetical protein